jgi:hypothetical protein
LYNICFANFRGGGGAPRTPPLNPPLSNKIYIYNSGYVSITAWLQLTNLKCHRIFIAFKIHLLCKSMVKTLHYFKGMESYCFLCTLDTIHRLFFVTRLIIDKINKVQWVDFMLENVLVSLHSLKTMGLGSIIFKEWRVTPTFSYTEWYQLMGMTRFVQNK